MSRKKIFIYNFFCLFILYFLISAAFTLCYIFLDYLDVGTVIDHHSNEAHQNQTIDIFTRSFYFSFITLFAVGYGDMIPLGLSKGVAIIQAFVGYIMPYAIILNHILFKPGFKKTKERYNQSNRL